MIVVAILYSSCVNGFLIAFIIAGEWWLLCDSLTVDFWAAKKPATEVTGLTSQWSG
jgi:hypothetical protein